MTQKLDKTEFVDAVIAWNKAMRAANAALSDRQLARVDPHVRKALSDEEIPEMKAFYGRIFDKLCENIEQDRPNRSVAQHFIENVIAGFGLEISTHPFDKRRACVGVQGDSNASASLFYPSFPNETDQHIIDSILAIYAVNKLHLYPIAKKPAKLPTAAAGAGVAPQ